MDNKEAIGVFQAHVIFACEKAGLSKAAVKEVEDALNLAIDALSKQETQIAKMSFDIYAGRDRPKCPTCGEFNSKKTRYCWKCGQRIVMERIHK